MDMGKRPFSRKLQVWSGGAVGEALLALFFFLGGLAGHAYAKTWDGEALRNYLGDYCALYGSGGVSPALLGCAALYFGWCLAVFLLGFASVGVALIPVLSGLFGFLTMYSVSCFVSAYGRSGILLAMGAMLPRLLVTVPCFLALAGAAWPMSADLAMLALGRGRRAAPVLYGRGYFRVLLVCAGVLSLGVVCERLLSSRLFQLALERVL
jgi:stage II sporulation protein M